MAVDGFRRWDAEDLTGRRWQLVGGEPMLMAPATEAHGATVNESQPGTHLQASGSDHYDARDCRGSAPERFFIFRISGVTCGPPSRCGPRTWIAGRNLTPGNEVKASLER
jgi:hypothetical protein